LSFFIKADFRGLVFFYKLGPIQFFLYNEGSFFYKKSAHFIGFNYFLSQNSDFVKYDIVSTKILEYFEKKLVVRCHFGFWPLGRVGFEVTFNLIRPEFFIKLAEFFFNLMKIGVF